MRSGLQKSLTYMFKSRRTIEVLCSACFEVSNRRWRKPCSPSSGNLLLRLMYPPKGFLTPHRFEGERTRQFCTECQASGLRYNDRSRQDSSDTTAHHRRVSHLASGSTPRHPQIDAVHSCKAGCRTFQDETQDCLDPLAIIGFALERSHQVLSSAHARASTSVATDRKRSPADAMRGKLVR